MSEENDIAVGDGLMSDDDLDSLDNMELMLGEDEDISIEQSSHELSDVEEQENKKSVEGVADAKSNKSQASGKKTNKPPAKKTTPARVVDMEPAARSIVLNIANDLFDRINKRKMKNVTLSRAIKGIVTDFVKDPKWCEKLFKSLKTERFDSLERGAPKEKAGYVNIYSPRLKLAATKLSEKLNMPEAHIVIVMVELQLRKEGDLSEIDLSEFKGALEL